MTVVVDDEVWTRRLDGRAAPIDPGPHHVRFASPGYEPSEQDILVNEGERARAIAVQLVATPRAPPSSEAATASSRAVPAFVWILGGGALGAGAGSIVFAADGFRRKHDLDASGCRPACDGRDVDAMKRSFVFADVLGGVAIAAVALGAYLWLARPAAANTVSVSDARSVLAPSF